MHGFGGYGKTIQAKSVCNDVDVKNLFRDGIYFEEFGREKTDDKSICDILKNIIKNISGEKEESDRVDDLSRKLIDVIGDKYVLIFLDDVWTGVQLMPFLSGCDNCVRLVTTRNKNVYLEAKNSVKIQGMNDKQAYHLLTYNIRRDIEADVKILLERLCKSLGYWPQMLSIINKRLYERVMVHDQCIIDAINSLEKSLEDKGFTAFDPDEESEVKRENTIKACVEVSLEDIGENHWCPTVEKINLCNLLF